MTREIPKLSTNDEGGIVDKKELTHSSDVLPDTPTESGPDDKAVPLYVVDYSKQAVSKSDIRDVWEIPEHATITHYRLEFENIDEAKAELQEHLKKGIFANLSAKDGEKLYQDVKEKVIKNFERDVRGEME